MPDKYADVRQVLSEVFHGNYRRYGYRRMHAALGRCQLSLSEKVAQPLIKQECLIVTANKKRRYGSHLGEISPAPENLINRDSTLTSQRRSG
jgi:putative transposase